MLRARLDDGLARLGAPAAALGDPERERLVRFVELLERWNRVHNLTAVRDAREMIGRHVLDSLALLPWLDGRDGVRDPAVGTDDNDDDADVKGADEHARGGAGRRVAHGGEGIVSEASVTAGQADAFDLLDIGSGGGLPVLPLAIARPALRCLSVESNRKKSGFQRQAVLELGLAGVEVRQARIETVEAQAHAVVSRAFAAPADFLALAAPRCAPGGTALVMLGRAERLPEPLPSPFTLIALRSLEVPFESGSRHLAVCRRTLAGV